MANWFEKNLGFVFLIFKKTVTRTLKVQILSFFDQFN